MPNKIFKLKKKLTNMTGKTSTPVNAVYHLKLYNFGLRSAAFQAVIYIYCFAL